MSTTKLPEGIVCETCKTLLKPLHYWKLEGNYFCSEECVNTWEKKKYG